MKKLLIPVLLIFALAGFAQSPVLKVDWSKEIVRSKSTPTLQLVVNPMIRPGAQMHDITFSSLRDLNADIVRFVPWFPYPKLVVAELEPPTATTTSWDFSLIDPMVNDFMKSTAGHTVMLNFSTIPQWMFKTDSPVKYPADPNQVDFGYGGGTEFRDTTLKELTDYYVRLISWYTKGGFTDELGKFHKSGYHYKFDYWEVLNEIDYEHSMTPQRYTKVYDAIVTALKPIMPGTKFTGLALAFDGPDYFEYFLNPSNHQPGVTIDMISYHFYSSANSKQAFDNYGFSYFDHCDAFLHGVKYAESIRKRLAPNVKTDLDELGTFINNDHIEPIYYNLSAAVYAYLFIELSKMQIDVIGESQLVGFPTQFPDVTMINYLNNKPNPRYWVLKMILDNIKSGSSLTQTSVDANDGNFISAQSFVVNGQKKVLLLNKSDKDISVKLPADLTGANVITVDGTTGDDEPQKSTIAADSLVLKPFSVHLIVLNK